MNENKFRTNGVILTAILSLTHLRMIGLKWAHLHLYFAQAPMHRFFPIRQPVKYLLLFPGEIAIERWIAQHLMTIMPGVNVNTNYLRTVYCVYLFQ